MPLRHHPRAHVFSLYSRSARMSPWLRRGEGLRVVLRQAQRPGHAPRLGLTDEAPSACAQRGRGASGACARGLGASRARGGVARSTCLGAAGHRLRGLAFLRGGLALLQLLCVKPSVTSRPSITDERGLAPQRRATWETRRPRRWRCPRGRARSTPCAASFHISWCLVQIDGAVHVRVEEVLLAVVRRDHRVVELLAHL